MMKRKNAVAVIIVLFICVAVYLNWNYEGVDNLSENGVIFGESKLVVNDGAEAPKDKDESGEEAEKASEESTEENTKRDINGDVFEYFDEARLEKQKARDSAINILKEAVEEENLSQKSRDDAAASIETLASGALSETRIETLVKAKGYSDCVALINESGVNVIVTAPEGGLTAADTTKIKDIVVSETHISPSQIKIIEIN